MKYKGFLLQKLSNSYRKNKSDIKALLYGNYPEFIYKRISVLPKDNIPVFVFHSVHYQKFELQLKYLAENGYKTLNSEQFYDVLTGKCKADENTVVLTFDDGIANIWTIVYPLLKKYSLSGIGFIIPSIIKDDTVKSPNLEDVWAGRNTINDLEKRELIYPDCNWNEIREIHKSGIIDFQSHTFFHKAVYISDELIDFANPWFNPNFIKHDHCTTDSSFPEPEYIFEYGYPIYKWDSNMSALTRFVENENLMKICVEYVKKNGSETFFQKKNWRRKLKRYYNKTKRIVGKAGKFQSLDERINDIKRDLELSKQILESKLDKPVEHLCYPWYKACELAVVLSKEAGFKSNYWGIIDNKSINHPGDNPFYISRISEEYLLTLPGKGRQQLLDILNEKIKSKILHKTTSTDDIFV